MLVVTTTGLTVVNAVAVLLPGVGSDVEDDTFTVFVMTVPIVVPAVTWTTIVKTALELLTIEGLVAVKVPVVPTAGVVTVHPPGAITDTNVVLAGSVSVTDTAAASFGPALVTVI